jgi:hypothetical protein
MPAQAQLGRYDDARHNCACALALARRQGNRNVVAALLDTLGYVAHHTGRHTEALGYYGEALAGFHENGHLGQPLQG